MLDLSRSEKDRQRFWHFKDYIWQLGRYAVVSMIRDGKWEGMLAF